MKEITLLVEENFGRLMFYHVALKAEDQFGRDIPEQKDNLLRLVRYIRAKIDIPLELITYVTSDIVSPELEYYVKTHMYLAKDQQQATIYPECTIYYAQVPEERYYEYVDEAIKRARQRMKTKYTDLWWGEQSRRIKGFEVEPAEHYETQIATAKVIIDDEIYTLHIQKKYNGHIMPNPGNQFIVGASQYNGRYYWLRKSGHKVVMSDNEAVAFLLVMDYIFETYDVEY